TAAFAAQPPPTATNSVAIALPSGGGNSSTRKTSSSTAMPVQRMRGLAKLGNLAFDPGADDVVRDRDRWRRAEPVGMAAQQHQGDLLALEPARALELGAVDLDVGGERLGVAADHQRHRERPGLRRKIRNAATHDAGLLEHLAPHRFIDVLARLDKAGEAR